jgi:hypothetical protein
MRFSANATIGASSASSATSTPFPERSTGPRSRGSRFAFRGAGELGEPLSSKGWRFAKRALSFYEVTNDGDEEGMLFLDRLPTPEEADIIRDKLGIPKKREISEEERARLAGMGHRFVARRTKTDAVS